MKAVIWITDEDLDQHKAGLFLLQNGRILTKTFPGNERVMRMIWTEPVLSMLGDEIDRDKEPVRWLEALPMNYTSTMLRAEFQK